MATVVDELIYRIGFDVNKDAIKNIGDGFGAVAKGAEWLAAAATGAAVALFALAEHTADHLEELHLQAKTLGITTEELQKMRFVADRAKVSNEELATSMKFMSKNLAEAAEGGGAAVDALAKLHINAQALVGMSADKKFRLIADAMGNIHDQGEKVELAMNIFGRSGAAMLNVMDGGTKTMDEISGRMTNLVSDEAIEKAVEFTHTMQEFWDVVAGIKTEFVTAFMPVMTEVVAQFRAFFIQNRAIIQSGLRVFLVSVFFVIKSIFSLLQAGISIVKWVVDAFGGLMPMFRLLQAGAVVVGVLALWRALTFVLTTLRAITIMSIAGRIFYVIDAIKKLIVWLRLTSISLKGILVATGIGILLLALQDLFAWVNGEPSLMGLLFGDFDKAWQKMKDGFAKIKAMIVEWWNSPIMKVIKGVVGGMATGGVVGAVAGGVAAYNDNQAAANNTTNNNVTSSSQISVHGVNDPVAAAAMVDNHLRKQAKVAAVTSNTGRQ